MSVLRIEHVTKEFKLTLRQRQKQKTNAKTLVAVNDLSFEAVPGVIYGLLGPNGAGKTTTLRMIASLIKPKTGAIYLDNKEINEDIYAYRKKIGFLTSELKLDGFFTPADTITYMGKLYGMSDEEINMRKNVLFRSFGVDKFQNTPINHIFSLVEKLCDHVGIIISGKLIKDAPLKEIQKEGTLEEVFFKLYEEANVNA